MCGAPLEYRFVTSDSNVSIFASRFRALFAFMSSPSVDFPGAMLKSTSLLPFRKLQPSVPIQIRQFLVKQCRRLCLEIGFCLPKRSVNPTVPLDPLSLLQIIERCLPALWNTENKQSDV